jgi:hypothetical protein
MQKPLFILNVVPSYEKKMDTELYKRTFERVNHPAMETTYPSEPIPQQNCVPVMASTFQIDNYEDLVYSPSATVRNVLSIFSRSLYQSSNVGKQQFLTFFLDEIKSRNIVIQMK